MSQNQFIKKIEVDGISLDVDKRCFESFDFLDGLSSLEDGEILAFPRVLKMICGQSYKRVKDELNAKHGGMVSAEEAVNFFTAIMTTSEEKN